MKGRDKLILVIRLVLGIIKKDTTQGHKRNLSGSPTPTESHFLKFPPASISMQYLGYQVINHNGFLAIPVMFKLMQKGCVVVVQVVSLSVQLGKVQLYT